MVPALLVDMFGNVRAPAEVHSPEPPNLNCREALAGMRDFQLPGRFTRAKSKPWLNKSKLVEVACQG